MTKVRKVLRNAGSGMWGYIELDQDNEYIRAVGNMEFAEKEEAEEYAKGFAPGSYEYVETKEMKIAYIEKLIAKTENDLTALRSKLDELNAPEVPEVETPKEEGNE